MDLIIELTKNYKDQDIYNQNSIVGKDHNNIVYYQTTQQNQKMFWQWQLSDYYYFSNRFWIATNKIMIPCFLFPCIVRFFNQDLHKQLWTDHIARFFLFVSWVFYIYDMAVKYPVDGAETICERSFFVHHGASLFIMPPLFMNKYIPWWVCPIGFMHGFTINFPEYEFINYVYAVCLFIFHYGIYQEPYRRMWGYNFLRFFINFIWIFALMLLLDNCSNFLPTEKESTIN